MIKFLLPLSIIFSAIFGTAANACVPKGYALPDSKFVLFGDRIKRGVVTLYPEDLLNAKRGIEAEGYGVYVVEMDRDEGGIMSTIYRVVQGSEETIIKVYTNYKGNGVQTRGLPKMDHVQPDLVVPGC